jgi:hypothetical protein
MNKTIVSILASLTLTSAFGSPTLDALDPVSADLDRVIIFTQNSNPVEIEVDYEKYRACYPSKVYKKNRVGKTDTYLVEAVTVSSPAVVCKPQNRKTLQGGIKFVVKGKVPNEPFGKQIELLVPSGAKVSARYAE